MERLGKVLEWHDDKGYGFIAALDAPGARLFFHIRDYQQAGRRPEVGELVRFAPGQGKDGRPNARSVRRAAQPPRAAPKQRASAPPREIPTAFAVLLLLAFAGAVAWAIQSDRLPAWAGLAIALVSAVAYMAYAFDKHAAERGRWRIQESTLHLFELLGGWPGALLAQRVMRHKTRKASYRVGFWMAVAANCAALGWWAFRH
ncbi:DUF1294 domain-containing protein [Lysobacter solisilvae (ex Woo and Kim 2020)]|uniref:Cold shock and DUF1294 domain-containing protein n=1 Tax=Agrilutibacter terrestris TaxID=2865112 RepID=A0A7H0FYS1_9GAMM|nr:DUF1294 domain-containing protein [Lysobacter terrestris]QNP41187.1 cold shock and DUF1294 domain-containing protein [Lysobacter terrestris]